jgi:hypothetical protein
MIPYIAYSFWEGDNLSLFHCYTIISLHKYNPDILIKVYTSSGSGTNTWSTEEQKVTIEKKVDFNIIRGLPNVEVIHIDFNEYSLSNDISVVYKADFIRIVKGQEHGGIWFDMDILFIAPIPHELFSNSFDIVCYKYNYRTLDLLTKKILDNTNALIPTGLLAISPNSPTINKIRDNLLTKIDTIGKSYQVIGPELWTSSFADTDNIQIRNGKEIYPYSWLSLDDLFNGKDDYTKPETWAIHWYNGAGETKAAINNYNFNELEEWDSVFGFYLRKILMQ